jgi:hypothetical protein
MKKFIIKLILVIAPLFVFMVAVNYYGDAANLFSIGYEKRIADNIIKGKNVTNIFNYDERLLVKHIVNNSKKCPEVLVIGSSRVMLINSSYFKNKNIINNGVSGASIEDLLAVYQLYEQKKCLPNEILIGIDPWTLNVNNGQTRWQTLNQEFLILSNKLTNKNLIKIDSQNESKYIQLISPSYFKSSFSKLFTKSSIPIATKNKDNDTFTKHVDGSISYDLEFRSATDVEVEKRVLSYLSGDIYSIEKFDKISVENCNLLEKFVKHLKNKNIKVSIFLSPYHPKVYSFITKSIKYKNVKISEEYIKDLGLKNNIEIIGSFNPINLKLDSSCFYDGMHCNEKGVNKILKKYK